MMAHIIILKLNFNKKFTCCKGATIDTVQLNFQQLVIRKFLANCKKLLTFAIFIQFCVILCMCVIHCS